MTPRAGTPWIVFVVGLLCCAPGAGHADEPAFAVPPEGDEAPLDCWPMPGGSPSRSGSTATPLPRGRLERAWSYAPGQGVISGEPLVWKHLVVVPFDDGFEVLDLATGGVIVSKRRIAVKTTAVPVVGPGFVLSRTAPDRLEAFSIDATAKSARSFWTWKAPLPLTTGPIVRGRDVFVCASNSVFRVRVGEAAPVWATSRPTSAPDDPTASLRLEGEPTLLGDDLLVARERTRSSPERGVEVSADLVVLDARNGESLGESYLSVCPGSGGDAVPEATWITGRTRGEVFVVKAGMLSTGSGASMSTAMLPRTIASRRETRLLPLTEAPVRFRGQWVLSDRDARGAIELGLTVDPRSPEAQQDPLSGGPSLRRHVLSSAQHSPELLTIGVPVTTTREAVLAGPYAFDARTRDVLHELPVDVVFRTIPARNTLLAVEGSRRGQGTRLHAFRPRRAPFAGATVPWRPTTEPTVAGAPVVIPDLTVVHRDGTVKVGAVAWMPGADAISFPPAGPAPAVPGRPTPPKPKVPPPPETRWALADVALVSDASRRVRYAGAPDDAIAAMRRAAQAGLAEAWLALSGEAGRQGAILRARTCLTVAEANGAPDAEVWRVRADLDAAERKPRKPSASAEKALAAKEAALREKTVGTAWSWAEGIPADAPPVLVARLARLALAADPTHVGPTQWVRTRIPPGLEIGPTFVPLEWLDFLDALHTTRVDVLDVPPVAKGITNSQRHLGAARATWRKDAVAFESRRAVVITPVVRPGRIARCLATAELLVRTLEGIFEEHRKKRGETDPLVMFLYETKDEYLARSGDAGDLEWTLGHYSPGEGVSRLFVPDGDEEFALVTSVFAHELTHHWMDLCCPAFSDTERVQGAGSGPGYWVEEGFAEFIEEGQVDLEAGRCELESAVAPSIDVVANVAPGELLPWDELYGMDAAGFRRLDPKQAEIQAPMRWKIGWHRNLSRRNLFYHQGAATVRYLYFADGGLRRKALLEFVATFHSSKGQRDTLAKLLGTTYPELGARVVAWCREQQRRPGR